MLDTLAVLRVLLAASPNMSLSQAFDLVHNLNACIDTKPLTLIDFARNNSAVMENVRGNRKIQAIKDLRLAAQADPRLGYTGLKEAKDACDSLFVEVHGVVSPRW